MRRAGQIFPAWDFLEQQQPIVTPEWLLARPFCGDVVQSRNLPGPNGSKSGIGGQVTQLVKEVVHLRMTMGNADKSLEDRNTRRTDVGDKCPTPRSQDAEDLPQSIGTVLRRDVVEA